MKSLGCKDVGEVRVCMRVGLSRDGLFGWGQCSGGCDINGLWWFKADGVDTLVWSWRGFVLKMGFDNECIPNIQSLAGEYFCPVCRLLVYPNEALQSQCTHLYCKPCLTYVVSTTRACPYDGYLVTEADSKPLVESNKTLAETIGKITVHCLFHRSGCSWQGPLSDCTSHCSGCSFGNSPVVCNRCGVQIVHRQVQEHAQSCPGVQHSEATIVNVAATGDQAQAATQTGATAQQVQTLATSSMPGQDPNQQAATSTQSQSVVQATVSTADQWYQHQQYYQQYPGYDPYQQHYQQYYPYQQAVPQYQQPQLQPQPQAQPQTQPVNQPQSQPLVQTPVTAQPQNQAQANAQLQTLPPIQPQSQAQPPPHGHLHAPVQPISQTNLIQPQEPAQLSQNQQPQHQHSQFQPHAPSQTQHQHHPVPQPQPSSQVQPHHNPQTLTSQPNQPVNPYIQPQAQQPSAYAVTGHHSYPQSQTHQQMPIGTPQHLVLAHPQGGPQSQSQHGIQMQSQFRQQPSPMRPLQSNNTMQNPQPPVLLPSPGQVPNVPPAPQQPVHSVTHQPALPIHQRPAMLPVQQQLHQQYVHNQYPFSGQPWGPVQNQVQQQGSHIQQQQQHLQTHLRPQGAPQLAQLPSHAYSQQNVALQHSLQPRPSVPLHATTAQSHPPSAVGTLVKATIPVGANQQSGSASITNSQEKLSSAQQPGAIPSQVSKRQVDSSFEKGAETKLAEIAKEEAGDATEIKTIKSENDTNPVHDGGKHGFAAQDIPESQATESGNFLLKQVKEEPKKDVDQDNITVFDHKQDEVPVSENKGSKDGYLLKTDPLRADNLEQEAAKSAKDKTLPSHGPRDQFQQKPPGPPFLQAPPLGTLQHVQVPGHPPRPLAPGHVPLPGQPLYPPSEQFQQPLYKQPHGAEISPSGYMGPGSSIGRGPSQYGPPHGPYAQGHAALQADCMPPNAHEVEMFASRRLSNKDGRGPDPFAQHSGLHSDVMRVNGTLGLDSSLTPVDRLRPFRDEHLNPFPQHPARRAIDRGEFEADLKHFPKPSHLGPEPVPKFGNHFLPSRPLHKGPHALGVDLAPRPLDKGSRSIAYDSGLTREPLGGPAPSRFFPPFHRDDTVHSNDTVERPVGFHANAVGRLDSSRTRPEFLGAFYGHGRHPMDDLAPRSPGSDYPGIPPRGFIPLSGADNVDGRESRQFGDPISSFRDSRFPVLPSYLHEGPGNLQMGEHLSGDLFPQDGRPVHLRRGEHFGPRNMPGHLRLAEPGGFGSYSIHAPMGELPARGDFNAQRFGEPGFRSNFSLKGFPSDGGSYNGDLESFDSLRKRKPSAMGWCRICKIDCETVEGLDMHSQTREHQKMAMDIVATIKRNAKNQKLPPSAHASLDT
ncbi:hypothetical protein Tsubulata_027263 [Turnera subulata]|uniref:RING-type domain-containing protein n=1 Tax=Turnera subulata TaxID=218843 RepID=A0A9Q0JEG5_9ROSI|nr:hypothetical protein Tsubulata_027263 [Turnera subulata]